MPRRSASRREDPLARAHQQLTAAVDALVHGHNWQQMLQVAARFPRYSPNNVLLITAQRPDATRVAGYRTWTTLGRHVKKGEHGIAILAPCTYKSTDTPATTATMDRDPTGDTRLPTVEPDEHWVEPAAARYERFRELSAEAVAAT